MDHERQEWEDHVYSCKYFNSYPQQRQHHESIFLFNKQLTKVVDEEHCTNNQQLHEFKQSSDTMICDSEKIIMSKTSPPDRPCPYLGPRQGSCLRLWLSSSPRAATTQLSHHKFKCADPVESSIVSKGHTRSIGHAFFFAIGSTIIMLWKRSIRLNVALLKANRPRTAVLGSGLQDYHTGDVCTGIQSNAFL